MGEFINSLPDWLHVLVLSMLPIIELRGAIPYGLLALQMPVAEVYFLAVIGSFIPAPFILLFIKGFLLWLGKFKTFKPLVNKINNKGIQKSQRLKKYSFISLIILVAIPLPGTGVWTGCLAAAIMKMNFKKALLATLIGTIIAGILVTMLVNAGIILNNLKNL